MLELYNHNKACQLTRLTQSVFLKAGIKTMEKVEGNARRNCVYGLHSFRHSLVSELFNSGVDISTIAHCYTGHGSNYMTELYSHASMGKKVVDLSHLTKIETKKVEVPVSLLKEAGEKDRQAYDEIATMDAPVPVKIMLKSLLQFKRVEELETIQKWLSERVKSLKA